MDSQTIRTALGHLQEDPDREEGWRQLDEAASAPDGDVGVEEALRLLAAARRAHQERGESEAVAGLLAVAVQLASGRPEEHDLLAEQARVLQDELFDEQGARAVLHRVIALTPNEAAVSLLSESEDKEARWQELAATYLEEAGSAPDNVYKSSMLMRAAEMELRFAGDAADHERIIGRLLESLELDPSNDRAAKMLERVYRREKRWSDVASLLERLVERVEPPASVPISLRLARVYSGRLGDRERAAGAYRRLLEIAPSEPEAMSFLSELYSQEERWDDLVAVYEKGLQQADRNSPERVGELLQIAMLHWRKRERPDDAEPFFETIRKLQPANSGMLQFFRERCEQTGDDARLLSILQAAQRTLPDGPERQQVTVEIAKLAEGQKDAQKAIEQYKSLLRQDPQNVEAREALKGLYKRTQGYNALVELLRQQLERVDPADKDSRLAILREVAGVYRDFIKSDTALVSVLNQILQIDETDAEAVRELIGLYEKLGRWRDLLTNQQRLADLSEDPAEKASLLRAVGQRWLDQFSNVQNATAAYEALLQVAPGDAEARERLEGLYKKRRAWPALYDLYEKQLGEADGAERLSVMREMAQLAAERLNRGADAIGLYRQILAEDPTNGEVLDALEKHAERAKDWPTLAEALERRVEILDDPAARLATLQKLGTVYADHVGDQQGATGAWRRVLELQPGHHRALRVLRDAYLAGGDFDGLEELYASQGDWEGLAEVLSNTADRTKDSAVKVDLSYRAAAVYEDKLAQPDRAFRSYERILATDPGDSRAARALVPLYEKDEKWARLPPLYELLCEKASDEAERLDHLKRLVEITGVRLSDRRAAVEFARKAYEQFPDAPETLELFEEACRTAGAWETFVEAVEARAKSKKKKQRRPLLLKLAGVYSTEIGRVDEAVATYRALLEANPADQDAGPALENILRREGRREDLRWLLELRVENAPSDADRLELIRDWAALEEDVFQEPARAAELHARALELAPGDSAALRALPRLLLGSGDAAGAARVIEQHREQAEDSMRADLEVQLAELYLADLDRPADALDAAVRALSHSEHDPRAIAVLGRLVDNPATRERAAEVLAAEYAATGDARHEADALAAMLEAATDKAERLVLFTRLADVHEEKLDSFNAALDVILRAVREHPEELELWQRADSLVTLSGRPTDLAEAFREALRADLPEHVELELCARAARLHEEKLGDPIGATPYLERTLAREPSNETAFGRLKQILTGAERWGELEALYDKVSQATDDPTLKTEMLAEVALVCEEIIEDAARATRYYERILEIEEAHEPAMNALDRLYEAQGRSRDLADLLSKRLESAVGEGRLDMKLRLGRILLEELHVPDTAAEHVEDVLRERPNDYDARHLAEKLLEIGSLRRRAAKMLESVYEERDEVRELVRVLEIQLEGLDTESGTEPSRKDERKDLLRRIATLRDERLHDDRGALEALSRYVPLDPLDVDARERLVEIGRRASDHERVAGVLERAAEAADTAGMRGEILMQVAHICEELLGDMGRAEGIYRKVLELDPDDGVLVLPAARALERVYTGSGEHQKLAEVLRIQIRLEDDGDTRQALQGRLGTLCEELLGDLDGAIEAWTARLEETAADDAALVALDRLYVRAERWSDLVQVLERRQDRVEDAAERRALMRRAAETLSDRLGNKEDAIEVWRTLVEDFGPDRESLGALEALYEQVGRFDDLAETYERHLELAETTAERLDLLGRLGDLRRQHHDSPAEAIRVYREALALDTSHEPSRAALEQLLEVEDALTRREAAEILHPIYEADGDNERLLRVLEIEIETADDPIARLAGLQQAMRVAEATSAGAERAVPYVERAVREAAGHAELASWLVELERLAAATGRRAAQVQLLRDVVDDIFDGDVQFEVTLKIAGLARDHLNDADVARTYFQKALEQRPDDAVALASLESLYQENDDVESLLDILQRRSDVAESEAEKKELLFRRARLLSERAENKAGAIEVYETILDLELDPAAVDALESLYGTEQRWEDLIQLYQRQLDASGRDAGFEVAELHVKIARIAARHLEDILRAFDEIETALEAERQHEGAVAELERLLAAATEAEHRARAASLLEPIYLLRADFDKVMQAISARLESTDDAAERAELLTRLAQLYEEQKEDYAAALETVAKLLHEDIAEESTIHEIERLAKVAGAERRLAEIYAAELEGIEGEDPATAHLAQRAGEIFASVGEHDRALTFYRRALAFEPENDRLFEAVDGLLMRTGRHDERVELYRDGLDHKFEPSDRLRMLHVIAHLQRRELDRPEEAIETYRAALEVDDKDEPALDALTELYRERERWDDLAELYTQRAEAAEVPVHAAIHRLALARLMKDVLRDPGRAIDQLEEIVQAVPTHEEAIRELEALREVEEHRERVVEILRPLYEDQDDWRRVIKLNQDRFDLAEDTAEKVAVLRETAELWEQRGGDGERARQALGIAVELDPDDGDVRAEYERLVEATEAWDDLAELYETVLADKPDLLARRELLLVLARIHDERRDDPRKALGAYDQLHALDEADPEPLAKMDELATLLSDWASLVRVLKAKAELALGDEERASLWRRVGEALRDMLDDRQGAREAYERALELEPESAFTVDCLRALYESGNDPERLVELYQMRVELAGDDEAELKYELLSKAAELYEHVIEDRLRAVEVLGQALAVRPGDPAVLAQRSRLYRAQEMWPELLDNLRLQAESAEAEDRTRLRKEMAKVLASKLESHEEALETFRTVLDEAPEDAEARSSVRKLGEAYEHLREAVAGILVPVLERIERPEELVEVLEMRLSIESDPVQRSETLRTMAEVLDSRLGRSSDALTALIRALSEQPEAPDLHERIQGLAGPADGWARYADALEEKAQSLFEPEVVKDLYARLGRVADQQLGDKKRAVDAYRRAAEQAGDQPDLLEALDRLLGELGDAESLSDVLERRIPLAGSDAEQAELHYRLAVLQIKSFQEPARGLASLRVALERAPEHEAAAQELEALTSERDLFEEAAEVLEGVYRSRGQTDRLAELYEKRVGFAETPAERIEMRRNLARVLEDDVGDASAAQRVLQQGLVDDPSDEALLSELERLAAATTNWEGAAAGLRDAIDRKEDLLPDVARDLCVRLSEWYRERVEDAAAAEAALLKALEFDRDNDEVLAQLERLQVASGRERDLVATLRRRAKIAVDEDGREDFYRRAKALADSIGDAALSESVLRELLATDETNLWALAELTALREVAGDFEETFNLLVRRVDIGVDEHQNRELLHRAAAIARERLDDADRAIGLYQRLFEDEPTDEGAARALRELYLAAERHRDLAGLLERLVDVAESPAQRNMLRMDLARLNQEQFGSVDVAIELLRAVLEEDPAHGNAVVALSELYEKTQRDEELAELLGDQIEKAREREDTQSELRFQVRLGEVYDARLGDRQKAIGTYRAVLERDPVHRGALEALARLFQAENDHREAAAALARLLELSEGEEAVRLALALAEEHRALGDDEQAASALERGLAVDERSEAIRDGLRGLYEKMADWEKLSGLIAGDAEAASEPDEKVRLLRRAAEIHAAKRGDHAACAELLNAASALRPDDRELMLELCDAYSASGRGKAAVEVLEKIVESYGGKRSKELGEIHRRLARAYLADGDTERAVGELDKAFRIEPGNIAVLKELGEVSIQIEDFKKAQQMYRALLLQKLDGKSPITKAEVFMHLGIVHHRLGEKQKAIQMLERALQTDAALEQAKELLAEVKG